MATSKNMIRVALVDDHPMMRRGLRDTLLEQGDFVVVGEGASADEAVELARTENIDVLIVDVNMPGGGLTAVERISKFDNPPKMLVLSVFDNLANVRTAMECGASGYVLKGVEGDELARVLRGVCEGRKHVGPELAAKLFAEPDQDAPAEDIAPAVKDERLDLLNKRERQIFDLIAQGLSNRAIAKKLKLGEETIKHYNTQMFSKLGVKNRTEAALLKLGRSVGSRKG